jgi:steroid 5-alpha reductase family enzyme
VLFCVVCALLWALDAVAGRRGWYRYVWHPSLFRIAVFTCLFGGLGLLLF